jgi:RNA polymerase sigma factor (sigma-70 family)
MEKSNNYPESELLHAIRTGKELDQAIRQIYLGYFDMACSYVLKNNGQREDAEDIFQEVVVSFISVVQQNKFRGESSVSTFLYSLTRHAWLNELKKRGRMKTRDEKFEKAKDTVEEDAANLMAKRESMRYLMDAVNNLGETCKKILLAFYFENLSMKEILQSLDYENEQVVRNKKYKCLKQLEQTVFSTPGLAGNLKSILSYE